MWRLGEPDHLLSILAGAASNQTLREWHESGFIDAAVAQVPHPVIVVLFGRSLREARYLEKGHWKKRLKILRAQDRDLKPRESPRDVSNYSHAELIQLKKINDQNGTDPCRYPEARSEHSLNGSPSLTYKAQHRQTTYLPKEGHPRAETLKKQKVVPSDP